MNSSYKPPQLDEKLFHCPHCGGFSEQLWMNVGGPVMPTLGKGNKFSTCRACGEISYWIKDVMVYPISLLGPAASPDMPEDFKRDYEEARSIAASSPRGAAALLRLVLEKLLKLLGESGDINTAIKNLKSKGVSQDIVDACDTLRVIGNEAVHLGEMDLRDTPEVVAELFAVLNYLIDELITRPKRREEVYKLLPQNKRDAIKNRDNK